MVRNRYAMAGYGLQELYQEYIAQRERNLVPEQVLKILAELQPNLSPEERQKLGQAIRQWELKRQSQEIDFGSKSIPPTGINCPHCQTVNPSEAKYCYACGELLSATSRATGILPDEIEDPALFGNLATLVITVSGYESKALRLQVSDRPLTIGRSDPASTAQPDIDLAPFGAANTGVSRLHAMLQRAQQTITIADKGSVNHTFINGEKLHPHEIRVIRDGDEVRFGRLVTRFTFHRELRRL